MTGMQSLQSGGFLVAFCRALVKHGLLAVHLLLAVLPGGRIRQCVLTCKGGMGASPFRPLLGA